MTLDGYKRVILGRKVTVMMILPMATFVRLRSKPTLYIYFTTEKDLSLFGGIQNRKY
jgi:hypothetical protein